MTPNPRPSKPKNLDRLGAALALSASLCSSSACNSPQTPPPRQAWPSPTTPEPVVSTPPPAPTNSAPPPPAAKPLLAITDPETLQWLESHGFGFRDFVLGLDSTIADQAEAFSTTSSMYQRIVDVFDADLREIAMRDRQAGVGMRHAHRLFNEKWLRSKELSFQLVGIVNRVDRRVFAPEYCGELRFVYRLAYEKEVRAQVVESRLPMTVNVVRWMKPAPSCEAQARRWLVPSGSGATWAEALTTAPGPLGRTALLQSLPKSIEVNLQSVRWPATVRPNMTGHAEYLLRVFRSNGKRLTASSLENTPDVDRLERDPDLARELARWLTRPDTMKAVDRGTVVVPERFLATRAVSVAPHGLARLSNRPYAQMLNAKDMRGIDFSHYETFQSFASFVRRLDGLSCMGCHQEKSLAGFHFLGEDDPERGVDALAVPFSPHFSEELPRRQRYLNAVAGGTPPDELRPPAERMGGGGYGAHCGLSGDFARWTCDAGYTCRQLHDPDVGQCMPDTSQVGDVCETGVITASANAHRDYLRLDAPGDCGQRRHCERSAVGFPGGMCSGGCTDLSSEATCGAIALLTEFNACLARGVPFETCVREQTRPGALRACSATAPCREDYVCARMPSGQGACIPPYFLFQLRVDGHVL